MKSLCSGRKNLLQSHDLMNFTSCVTVFAAGTAQVGLHVYMWQTVEGWLHRAVMHWLAEAAASPWQGLAFDANTFFACSVP